MGVAVQELGGPKVEIHCSRIPFPCLFFPPLEKHGVQCPRPVLFSKLPTTAFYRLLGSRCLRGMILNLVWIWRPWAKLHPAAPPHLHFERCLFSASPPPLFRWRRPRDCGLGCFVYAQPLLWPAGDGGDRDRTNYNLFYISMLILYREIYIQCL